jgi:hypothetical protein
MQKNEESIWTKDITPHVVNFMTADITPDFSSDLWTKDITHLVVGSLAVFGLVVSAGVMTLGVAALGVQTEVAFAQQESAASQTASVALAEGNRPVPASAVLLPNAPTGTSTMPARPAMPSMASSTAMFCPKIERTIGRGNFEGTTTGNIGQLQQFMAQHFNIDTKDVVTGFFGSTTQSLLQRFQQEQGIPPAPQAGPLTRAAIARLCNPSSKDPSTTKGDINRDGGNGHMGSSTPMMGSTTPPMPPRHDDMRPAIGSSTNTTASGTPPMEHHERPMPPKATTTPVTYIDSSSNTASVLEAINEIGDGYGRLFTAGLSMLGL